MLNWLLFLKCRGYLGDRLWSRADFSLYLGLLKDLERERLLRERGVGCSKVGSNLDLYQVGALHAK